jgi:hypothetical protein
MFHRFMTSHFIPALAFIAHGVAARAASDRVLQTLLKRVDGQVADE